MATRTPRHYVAATTLGLVTLLGCTEEPLFTQLPAKQTGITFANTITESDSINPISIPNVYNGGGLATGDFNADGRLDLYFTGNMVANALYLNRTEPGRGDWQFEDVTQRANVAGAGRWNAGAAVVDINADGRLDLYVCAGLKPNPADRRNLLYVNQGNDANGVPRFRDMAADYGLADTTSTTQAAFFDYDNDGDLDVYLLVDYIYDLKSPNTFHDKIRDGSAPNNDQLYRNDWDSTRGHPVFTNVTKQAGITLEGYGLGVSVCDLNKDGWQDLYVTNDFISNDFLWINNKNGTFTNRAPDVFKHTSLTAMGNDVADLNNDGHPELVAMDMMAEDYARRNQMDRPYVYNFYEIYRKYGYEHQYKRNTLQLNLGPRPNDPNGLPAFSEVAYLTGLAYTDWSWSPLAFDADHDGYRDLFVTNGYARDLTDNDFMAFRNDASNEGLSKLALTKQMPQIRIPNYAFRNQGLRERGALGFSDVSAEWGVNQPSYSHAAVYGDFDNDGDLDYVVNNLNEPAFVYRNNRVERGLDGHHSLTVRLKGTAQNPLGYGATVTIRRGADRQTYTVHPCRGYLAYQPALAHFGLGEATTVDEVTVTWPGGAVSRLTNVVADQPLTVDQRSGRFEKRNRVNPRPLLTDVTDSLGINYVHQEPDFNDFDFQSLLPHKLSQYGPRADVGDLNGDGLDDVVLTAAKNEPPVLFLQTAAGRFVRKNGPGNVVGQPAAAADKDTEQSACALFDADGDGDLDWLMSASGYEKIPYSPFAPSRLFLNDGRANFTEAVGALPTLSVIAGCVRTADFDRDGDLDLFIGNRVKPNQYPRPVSSYVLRNDSPRGAGRGGVRFSDVTGQVAPGLKDIGMIGDARWTDLDNDGWPDLLLAGEWMPLTVLKNERGQFAEATKQAVAQSAGLWNVVAAADLDGDGDTDYVVGNRGQNAMIRPTPDEPMRVYAGDFNDDGRYDAIPTGYFRKELGKPDRAEFAMYNRDDLIKQYQPFRRRFTTYRAHGQTTIDKLLTDEERKLATVLSAECATTAWLENRGNGELTLHPLPWLAQVAPVFGVAIHDLNADRRPDILLVGNDFGNNHVEGRQDALNGLVLLGDGKGGFVPQYPAESGFWAPGDAKSLLPITVKGKPAWLVTQNQGPLRVFAQP